MSKFCRNCGSELVDGAKACGNCGTFIDEGASTNNSNPNNGTVNVNNNVPKKNTDVGAIGFWISLVSTILCCGSFNIISLILCIIGLVDSKNNPNNNKGLAIAGIVISSIGFILQVIFYVFAAMASYI